MTALANQNKIRTLAEALMAHAEEVIERAHSVLAALRAKREREAERRKEVFGRIDISKPLRMPKRGIQLSLKLQ
ncbi:hypothetical protein PYH37_006208 (plasmid) [Sinorhizobium numidicum]|uniref:Transposase n=1 Tax=Sinorhizobium numidicum TaxID=680248 RepID=A0ABY8D4D7_9HYPH|nr:hypothetical protein [Sinorhizobium numidicum]WEX79746.1 hypothetical protein PYH37_006208 [Sinorhizobium numidicum]WEX85725.1 hypothetical protein PYH38_006176 [Sinorhizobium numidicum]